MSYMLESRQAGETPTTSYMLVIPLLTAESEELKSLLMRVKQENESAKD